MKQKQVMELLRLNREIQLIARDLPSGKFHKVVNRINKSNLIIKKEYGSL